MLFLWSIHIPPGLELKDIHNLLDTHACSSVVWWALKATFGCGVKPHPVVPGLIWEVSTYLQPHLSPQHPPQPREVGRPPLHTQSPCQDPEWYYQQQPRQLPCSCDGLVPCRNRLSTSFASALGFAIAVQGGRMWQVHAQAMCAAHQLVRFPIKRRHPIVIPGGYTPHRGVLF